MKKCLTFAFFIILSSTSSLFAVMDQTDYKAFYYILENFKNSWNDHAGKDFAKDYRNDADFVDVFGMAFSGKKEIEEKHISLLESIFKGSTLEVTNFSFREAKPNVVIAQIYWKISNIQKHEEDQLKETINGVGTHVLLKENGNWEITASQSTMFSN